MSTCRCRRRSAWSVRPSGDARRPSGAPDAAHHTRRPARGSRPAPIGAPARRRPVPCAAVDRAPISATMRRDAAPPAPRLARRLLAGAPLALVAARGRRSAHGGTVPAEPPTPADAPARLVVRPAGLAAGARGPRAVVDRRPAGRPAPPGQPGARAPDAVSWAWASRAAASRCDSGIERYDTTLFSVHMVQHLLLMLVARAAARSSPAPVTLLLRASTPGDPPALDPARPPLADRPGDLRSRSSPGCCSRSSCGRATSRRCSTSRSRTSGVHRLEHVPVPGVGAPVLVAGRWRATRRRGGWPPAAEVLYVGLQMPQNTFLALAILYRLGAALPALRDDRRAVGPDAAGGPAARRRDHVAGRRPVLPDGVILLVCGVDAPRRAADAGEDRRLDAERAAIRERAAQLAARRAAEAREPARRPRGVGAPVSSGGIGASR